MLISSLLGALIFAGNAAAFDDEVARKVRDGMMQISTHSWEIGTASQALFEYEWPSLSVFSPTVFPLPEKLTQEVNAADILEIAAKVMAKRPAGSPTYEPNGAAGDPPSQGMAVLFANWTMEEKNATYAEASYLQLEHLLTSVRRTPSGAISHREDDTQLWSDFVSMVPPFFAYYGAIQNNATLLQAAYDQCRLYRQELGDESGLWKHIQYTTWGDLTHWGTGNAWAAGGMLRVHQTIAHSALADDFVKQRADLEDWINEITTTAWKYQAVNGTLLNTIDNSTSFADSAGTSLLAAVSYRMATITGDSSQLIAAERAYECIKESIDTDGWVLNAVDPLTFNTPLAPGKHSPEAQAFALMLHSARRDFYGSDKVSKRHRRHSIRRLDLNL